MLDRFLEALTGRRVVGALFVLGGLVVAAAVLWPNGDGGGPRAAKPAVEPARIVAVPQLGLAFAYPRAWRRTVAGRVIRLRSPDGSSVMTFSSPLDGRHPQRVIDALKDALRTRFAPAKIVHEGPGALGSRTVSTFELEGGGTAKDGVRALVLVGSSSYRTYAVTLLTPRRPSAKSLAEARQILATVSFTKPMAAAR